MAITIDWPSGVISVQQSDTDILTDLGGGLYKFDTDAFRLELKDLEDSEEGMPWTRTHLHNTTVAISGVTYVRAIELLAPYTIQFLPNSQWSVLMDGQSNNNFHDVQAGRLTQNQVQVIPQNSAGNTVVETGVSGLTTAEADDLLLAATEAELARKLMDADRVLTDGDSGNMLWIDADDGVTVLRTKSVKDKTGGAIVIPPDAPAEERRD